MSGGEAEVNVEVPIVQVVEGYEPAPGLQPMLPSTVMLNLNERVALQDDHPLYPGMYGTIKAIGFEDGYVKMDVALFHPASGCDVDANGDTTEIARITMADIQ